MKYLISLATIVAFAVFAAAALATTTSLHVVGSSHSSGAFAITAANASVHSNAIYVRAYGGGPLSVNTVVACSHGFSVGSKSQTFTLRSGAMKRLSLPNGGGSCDVTAGLSGSGSIRLQILAG